MLCQRHFGTSKNQSTKSIHFFETSLHRNISTRTFFRNFGVSQMSLNISRICSTGILYFKETFLLNVAILLSGSKNLKKEDLCISTSAASTVLGSSPSLRLP